MKLILAVVHDEDAVKVIDSLNNSGLSITKLATTGGFLRAGNTTILVGVEDNRVDEVVEIIKKNSRSRKSSISGNSAVTAIAAATAQSEIVLSSATVFVLEVECFKKV